MNSLSLTSLSTDRNTFCSPRSRGGKRRDHRAMAGRCLRSGQASVAYAFLIDGRHFSFSWRECKGFIRDGMCYSWRLLPWVCVHLARTPCSCPRSGSPKNPWMNLQCRNDARFSPAVSVWYGSGRHLCKWRRWSGFPAPFRHFDFSAPVAQDPDLDTTVSWAEGASAFGTFALVRPGQKPHFIISLPWFLCLFTATFWAGKALGNVGLATSMDLMQEVKMAYCYLAAWDCHGPLAALIQISDYSCWDFVISSAGLSALGGGRKTRQVQIVANISIL